MIRSAFSTVGCPERTIEDVIGLYLDSPFDGIEFRTFGDGSTRFACDPALTSRVKLRRMLESSGVSVSSLATSARFDEPLMPPPPVGYVLGDSERCVREAKQHIDLAAALGVECVRVFGFEGCVSESWKSLVRRMGDRLKKLADHARNTSVSIVLENGGDCAWAEQVLEVVDLVSSPHLRASYSLSSACGAGEDPIAGMQTLGSEMRLVRVRDLHDGKPVMIGDGELPCEEFCTSLRTSGYDGWVVWEWDRAWLPELARLDDVLSEAGRRLNEWTSSRGDAVPAPETAGAL
ncbi:MAG: sugar phosphate isomerase/epimerase family protein [Planctomycetota bacterium]|jgi:sugar phosphate isomerase/epimerase